MCARKLDTIIKLRLAEYSEKVGNTKRFEPITEV